MRWVLSRVPVLPFSKSSLADIIPAGIPFPDELLGFLGGEASERESEPPSTRVERRRSRTMARGGYRPL